MSLFKILINRLECFTNKKHTEKKNENEIPNFRFKTKRIFKNIFRTYLNYKRMLLRILRDIDEK